MQGKYTPDRTNTDSRVFTFGKLMIQVFDIQLPYATSTVMSFPTAFPEAVLGMIVQGQQVTESSGYSAPNSIQAQAISLSQFRVYMNSTVSGATMNARVIAIGT